MDDIRPPRRMMDVQPRSTPQPVQRTATQPVRASTPQPSVTPSPAPAPPTPSVSVTSSATPSTPAVPATPDQAVALTGMTLPPKVKAPVAAIVLAVLVCLGLIGLTVFAYLKTQSDTKSNGDNQTTQQTEAITPEAVDASQESIDAEIGTTNDDQDFNAAELSDESLGL